MSLATVDRIGATSDSPQKLVTRFSGGSGANDGDTVIDTVQAAADMSFNDVYLLTSVAGAMEVFPSLDGVNFATSPLSLIDMGATTSDPVTITAAGRIYGFFGPFVSVHVKQSGATAVTGAAMLASKKI